MNSLGESLWRLLWFGARVIIFLLCAPIILFVGYWIAKTHDESIAKREADMATRCPAVTVKRVSNIDMVSGRSVMVTGNVVLGVDYMKRLIGFILNIVGLPLWTHQRLLDRARREAILRLQENAKDAKMIVNVRVETATINSRLSGDMPYSAGFEMMAYGTAIYSS